MDPGAWLNLLSGTTGLTAALMNEGLLKNKLINLKK